MKVKLFSKQKPLGRKGKNQLDLQNEINDWLEKNSGMKRANNRALHRIKFKVSTVALR